MLRSGLHIQRAINVILTGGTLFFFPKSITPIIIRTNFQQPMVIQKALRTPPKEAFEDLFSEHKEPPALGPEKTNLNVLNKLRTDWNPTVEIASRRAVLAPLLIGENTEEKMTQQSQIAKELTLAQRTRLELAQTKQPIIELEEPPAVGEVSGAHKINLAQGKIRLAPGLALGDRTLEIQYLIDGAIKGRGEIDVQKGIYKIQISDSQEGQLRVNMQEKTGVVVASGQARLGQHQEIYVYPRNQMASSFRNFHKDPNRIIETAQKSNITKEDGEPAEVFYASFGASEKTDPLGSVNYQHISQDSWSILRAQAKGFYETLYLASADNNERISLLSEGLVGALKNLTSESDVEAQGSGIIWGQVLLDNQTVAGVSISIEGTDKKATYLESFIPNPALEATTSSGYFIFKDLPAGMYSLVAKVNGEYFAHANVVVDDNSVALTKMESRTQLNKVSAKVYDAFTGEPQNATAAFQSLKDNVEIFAEKELYFPNLRRHSLVGVTPQDSKYLSTQYVYSDDSEYIHLPLVQTQWLQWMSANNKISIRPNSAIIVGFVPEDDFEVFLTHEQSFEKQNIMFFDKEGNAASEAKAGGGFVLFNVPTGAQSVVVLSKKSEMLSVQVVPAEANTTTVLKFHF